MLRGQRQKKISTQNTVTCILAFIAPLQYLATIAQWVFSFLFGTYIFAALACGVTVVAFLINVIFQFMYGKKFNSKQMSADDMRRVREGKIQKKDVHKYVIASDKEFGVYVKKHRCANLTISSLTFLLCFKLNKLYYSHFYMFDMFKARWTDHKFYRKMMTWYCIVWMITVDLFLICIDITGLFTLEWGNQLYITMIETLVLSLLGIFLGSYELYRLKDMLKYSESQKTGPLGVSSGVPDDFLDKDSREKMIKDLLAKVKDNKDIFLNNKLDELLDMFGDRRCKSMIELSTGWPLEEDPRKI